MSSNQNFQNYPLLITQLHTHCLTTWTKDRIDLNQEGFFRLVEENHAFNYQLWNAEDRARRDDKGFEFVYLAKREIDQCNQQRNNRMEAMDNWLSNALSPSTATNCPVHSETPGLIIDRLSILALKNFHMEIQTQREDVEQSHRETCLKKLAVLQQQQMQLQNCLTLFFNEILLHQRTFRIYHQFKMYNDPSLNPELYESSTE